MTRLGVELGPHAIRAVLVGARSVTRAHALEFEWDPDSPDDGVRALQEQVGAPRRIAVAVDLPLLITKRVKLPALSAAERRNVLCLEPDRFFAVRTEAVVPAVRADDDLVFAVSESKLARWITALERIAPVDVVEPLPQAIARAFAHVSVHDAVVVLEGAPSGLSLIQIRDGRVIHARRVFGDLAEAAVAVVAGAGHSLPAVVYASLSTEDRIQKLESLLDGVSVQPLPVLAGVPGGFLGAYGAALGINADRDVPGTLISSKQSRAIQGRRHRALGLAGAACAVALVFALLSVDAARARASRQLDASLTALRQRAAPALALAAELETLGRRQQAIRAIESQRADPLQVLLALSRRLPPGAFIGGIRSTGADWQIDGYAPNAANVLTALGAASELKDVHFLAAMNRAQFHNQPYESFALAFRFASAP